MKPIFLALLFLFSAATTVHAKFIPEVWGQWAWPHDEPVHVVVSPGGGGTPLAAAEYSGGALTDGTIRIQLWVLAGQIGEPPSPEPVANFPREDLWLEFPGLQACWTGMSADAHTDAEGWFTFSNTLTMGGWNDPADPESFPHVMVNGTVLLDENRQVIRPTLVVNSPDLNGDLAVNLFDISAFTQDYYGPYAYRGDFSWDGVLNLTDLVWLSRLFGETCP